MSFDLASAFGPAASVIGWLSMTVNTGRVASHVPHILAQRRGPGPARPLSTLTCCRWLLPHFLGMCYAALVTGDDAAATVSMLHLACCAVLAAMAARPPQCVAGQGGSASRLAPLSARAA